MNPPTARNPRKLRFPVAALACRVCFATSLLMGVGFGWAQPAPVARYTFDDGTANDSSGNFLHGSLVGGAQIVSNASRPFASTNNRVLVLNGQVGGTGTNQSYVNLSDPSGLLNFAGTNATVAAWVYMSVSKSHNTIFSQGEWQRGASLTIKGDSSPANKLWAGKSPASLTSSGSVPLQQWMHVAAVWRVVGASTEVTFYTNGITNGTFTLTGTLQSPVNGSAIGREWRDATQSNLRWVFNGMIDELQVFNSALAANEVAQVYAGGVSPPENAPTQFNLAPLGVARQTGGDTALHPATLAVDGSASTFSETPDVTNSFWELELERPYPMTRLELVPPADAGYGSIMEGLVVRISDLRDRTLFQATVGGPGTWATNFPAPVNGRIIRVALEGGQTNGAGDHRIALAEVRAFGNPSPTLGPVNLSAAASVTQSGTNGVNGPQLGIDRNTTSYFETLNQSNSWWLLTLDQARPVQRVELVNRSGATNAPLMQGLTLRILDDASNTVASATVPNPGAGNRWAYVAPPNTTGRYLRIGLENGATNGQGNYIVSLAEVSVVTATNLALGRESYQTRISNTVLPATNVNDGSYSTETFTPLSTHEPYWEVNLGSPHALDCVRIIAAAGYQSDMTHATLSVFDSAHSLVFARHLAGATDVFDVALPQTVVGQYVRVGVEYAERTRSGSSWFIGMKEVEVYGQATNAIGVSTFTAAQTNITGGASTELAWQEAALHELRLHPGIGSVGAFTDSSGLGAFTVTPPASTEYILVGSNYSGHFIRHATVTVNGAVLPPRISEFMAANELTVRDGNKDASDWIELHNPNDAPVDLSSHYLSDNPASLTKWAFPAGTVLPPHGYLLVFASGATQSPDPAGLLHANFSLAQSGESVLLTAPDGVTVLDAITNFPPQMIDLAYGRTLEGIWSFLEPTPAGPNVATSYEGWLSPPSFSHDHGWHTNSFSLAIGNPNSGATLYWSTNGTDPTNDYTAPLAISDVTSVRAQVARPGYKSPRVQTRTYLFLDGIVNSPSLNAIYRGPTYTNRLRQGFLDLPVLSISVPPSDPKWDYLSYNKERPEREASLEIFLPDGTKVQANCGLTQHGGHFGTGTGNPYAKKSWQVKFRSEYGTRKLEFPLFQGFGLGVAPRNVFDELDIHAGNHDMSSRGFYMSHRFAADTMLEMGNLNPHGRFVHLFFNGAYLGQFDAHERLTDAFLSEYLGGAKEDYLSVKGNDNSGTFGFVPGVPDPDPPGREPWETVRANRSSYAAIKDLVNMPGYIDWVLLWQWGNGESEYRSAGDRIPSLNGSRGFMFWMADADGFLRQQSGASGLLNKNNVTTSVFTNGPGYIFGALLAEAHPDFKTLLADRIYKHFFHDGAMTPQAAIPRLNARMNEITNSMVAECARWGGTTGRTPESWLSDAQYARDNIFPVRLGTLVDQFRAANWYPAIEPPEFSQQGGSITNGFPLMLSAGPGTVYYTLDGSDVRLPGGNVSPTAIIWSGQPVILTGNTTVKARLHNGTVWSALNEATFRAAHPLAAGPYLLTAWNASEPAGTYPPHLTFGQNTSAADPGLAVEMDSLWTQPYNLASRSRINGLGTNGFAFINTDNAQAVEGAGFLGTADLALNTLGADNVRVTWTGGTVTPNARVYGIRLQYRVGDAGAFTDVLNAQGNPVEYLRNPTAGHAQTLGPVTLPTAASQQPYVQLRWKYYYVSGASGARAQLRVDDIRVAAAQVPALANIPDQFVHLGQSLQLTAIVTNATEPLLFSLTNSPSGAVIHPASGLFNWTALNVPAPGTNAVTVRVDDNGLPPLTDEQTFQIIVQPPPQLTPVLPIQAGDFRLTFNSLPGWNYLVEYKDDLTSPNWTPLGAAQPGTGNLIEVTDTATGQAQRYYRLTVTP